MNVRRRNNTLSLWFGAARPRTLPAAIAPVLVGSGAAAGVGEFHLGLALLAAGVALALQVGVNFANDYSDGVRGTDAHRTGPARLTAGGSVAPHRVKGAAFGAFGVAACFGLTMTILTGHWVLLVAGALAVLAAWYYTGGKHPYGYAGLGEVFVFLFFGLVATLGTTYVQAGRIAIPAIFGAVSIGLLACAILMVNNIRDIPTDQLAGKHTLAVKIGDSASRIIYQTLIWLALAIGLMAAIWFAPWGWLLAGLIPAVVVLTKPVRTGAQGAALIPTLAHTAWLELAFAVIATGAFAASPLWY